MVDKKMQGFADEVRVPGSGKKLSLNALLDLSGAAYACNKNNNLQVIGRLCRLILECLLDGVS
jgi:hypothetical protein